MSTIRGQWVTLPGTNQKVWEGPSERTETIGQTTVRFSFGEPSRVDNCRLPDGSRGHAENFFGVIHSWRYVRKDGEFVWGRIQILHDEVVFLEGVPFLDALAADERVRTLVMQRDFAIRLYAGLCNTEWHAWHNSNDRWSCGLWSAAWVVTYLRGLGEDYMEFYLRSFELGIQEGTVSQDVETELARIGWLRA